MLDAIFGPRTNLGDEFVELIHGLTEGNPFFVEETLKALMVAGDLVPRDGGWRAQALERVRVPRTAIEAVRRRIATLTVPARSVASIAAVTGRRFDFELLRTLSDVDEDELLALVKELIAAQLVVEETGRAVRLPARAHARGDLRRSARARARRAPPRRRRRRSSARTPARWKAWSRRSRTTRGRRASGRARRSIAARAARHAMALSAPREAVAQLDRAFQASEKAGITVIGGAAARARVGERDARRVRSRARGLHLRARARARRGRSALGVGGAPRARYALGGARLLARGRLSPRRAAPSRERSATTRSSRAA